MTCNETVLIRAISRQARNSYGIAYYAGLSDRLLLEAAREFRALKASHGGLSELGEMRLMLHALLRTAQRSEREPTDLLVVQDEFGELDP